MRALVFVSSVAAERSVSVWQTAQGTGDLIAPKPPVPFSQGSSDSATLSLDANTVFQTMLGFGGALRPFTQVYGCGCCQ